MTDVAAGNIWEVDIVQLKQANATMPLANQALASDDVATLTAFGFSHAPLTFELLKGVTWSNPRSPL